MIFWNIFILILLGIVLAVSANAVVRATSFVAKTYQVKSFILGFLLLGAATNTPEIFVAIQSVRNNVPQLAVGNLLGGSILLLSFFMGASAILLGKIVLNHGMTRKDIALATFTIMAPVVVVWDGKLTQWEGLLLLCLYLIHVIFMSREQHVVARVEHHAKHVKHMGHAIFLGSVGLLGIGLSSHFFVLITQALALEFGISAFVLGLFLVTFGTNLPELSLVVSGVLNKKQDVAFGDILGSTVMHTPVLGVICLLTPSIMLDPLRMRATLILLGGTALFFWWAAGSKRDITRREGVVLLLIYGLFVAFELLRI